MTGEEWEEIRTVFERKATILLKHEGKEMAFVGLPPKNYTERWVKGRRFISVATNLFKDITEVYLAKATSSYPKSFGKGSTSLVIDALNATLKSAFPYFVEKKFNQEEFCLVFDIEKIKDDKVLRIDLFRDDLGTVFRGGLMHAFNHFNFQTVPLSTGKGENGIAHPLFMIHNIIDAFFHYKFQPGNRPNSFLSETVISGKKVRFVFYLETTSNVYFVDSIYIIGSA
ncbi:MAG: hypothetical protein JST90_04190 [Bacteroidetes bacterium]|nr:hypothetical protein [Bacteroidota bacterium]